MRVDINADQMITISIDVRLCAAEWGVIFKNAQNKGLSVNEYVTETMKEHALKLVLDGKG